METVYWLCNCYFLDSDYNHTIDFNNKSNQLDFFRSKTVYVLNDSQYQRKGELEIRLDKSMNELKNINYLVSHNSDGNIYYYFIIQKEYNNDYSTIVYLQMDLIQTYLFDIQFKECLIDRQHIDRWVTYDGKTRPNLNLEEEGIDIGDYEIKAETEIYNYRNKGTYIISSSERLGISTDPRTNDKVSDGGFNPGGGGGVGDDNYKTGYLNENGIRLIKSLEGFRSEPYNIGDGTNTIGYGVTQVWQPSYYNQLYPSCTERQASEILGKLCYEKFSSQVKIKCDRELGSSWLNQNRLNALTSYMWQWGNLVSGGLWNVILQYKDNEEALVNAYKNLGNTSGYATRRNIEAEAFRGNYGEMKIGTGTGYVTENNGKGYIPSEYL